MCSYLFVLMDLCVATDYTTMLTKDFFYIFNQTIHLYINELK